MEYYLFDAVRQFLHIVFFCTSAEEYIINYEKMSVATVEQLNLK